VGSSRPLATASSISLSPARRGARSGEFVPPEPGRLRTVLEHATAPSPMPPASSRERAPFLLPARTGLAGPSVRVETRDSQPTVPPGWAAGLLPGAPTVRHAPPTPVAAMHCARGYRFTRSGGGDKPLRSTARRRRRRDLSRIVGASFARTLIRGNDMGPRTRIAPALLATATARSVRVWARIITGFSPHPRVGRAPIVRRALSHCLGDPRLQGHALRGRGFDTGGSLSRGRHAQMRRTMGGAA